MKIKELKNGTIGTVEAVICAAAEKTNKNDGSFVTITFSDGESIATGKKWNTKLTDLKFEVGQAVFLEVKTETYKDSLSYIIRDITESSADPEKFICGAPVETERMYSFLARTAEKCGVYAPVVKKMLSDNKENLLYWGAAHSVHHNIRGGLLYHTYRMVKTAAYVANVYNKDPGMAKGVRVVNTELLVGATIIHDIGKLQELETNTLGDSEYTPKGVMLGHLYLGAELFSRYAREAKLNEEDVMLMEHMILSHHGLREYGTVAVPAIPEAMLLHHIDMMDSYIYQFEVRADAVEPGCMTTDYGMTGNRVYRPTWRVPVETEASLG